MTTNKEKLTDALIARAQLPKGADDHTIWDTEVPGFGLRIRPGGSTFILNYRPAGAGRSANTKRFKIGTPATIETATEARRLARVMLGRIAEGRDPGAERAEQKRRQKARVAELLAKYERDLERRNYVNVRATVSGLRLHLAGHLKLDIRDLTGATLASIFERLQKERRPGAAENFRSRCRAFLTWAVVKAKVIERNPLMGFRKERPTRADRIAKAQRGRALPDADLVKVWRAADPATNFGRYVRFLVLTGCRRNEGAGVTRGMLNKDQTAFDLPAVFTKQGRGHRVPIVPLLQDVLDACVIDARSDLFFASPRSGGPLLGWTQQVARFNKTSGVDFKLHDLRRTFRTGLSRLGISKEIAELAIGHAREELEQIYNRDNAEGELRKAFEAWADHVAKIVKAAEAAGGEAQG